MFKKIHTKHQHLLVTLFHNCYHVIPSYIFHYTLKAFETRIWLKNTHVCNCKIEIHNKCKKKVQHVDHFNPILAWKFSNLASNFPNIRGGFIDAQVLYSLHNLPQIEKLINKTLKSNQ